MNSIYIYLFVDDLFTISVVHADIYYTCMVCCTYRFFFFLFFSGANPKYFIADGKMYFHFYYSHEICSVVLVFILISCLTH